MNRRKIHQIVEYIRSLGEFPYDTHDVEDELSAILASYGFADDLTEEERFSVLLELTRLARSAEIAEAVKWAHNELGWESRPQGLPKAAAIEG